MRTNEERIAAMHASAAKIERRQRAHRVKLLQSAGAALSFAAVILLAVFMPKAGSLETVPGGRPAEMMNASMLGSSYLMGYAVIAVVAFLLGASVTAFCYHLKKWQDEKDEEAEL